MYCKNCGAEIREGAIFCTECGESVETIVNSFEIIEEQKTKGTKVWDIFSKIGYIGGLVCFICSFVPFINIFACSFGIYFIVFSALGKKTQDEALKSKASKGLVFSILATVIGFVGFIIIEILLELAKLAL